MIILFPVMILLMRIKVATFSFVFLLIISFRRFLRSFLSWLCRFNVNMFVVYEGFFHKSVEVRSILLWNFNKRKVIEYVNVIFVTDDASMKIMNSALLILIFCFLPTLIKNLTKPSWASVSPNSSSLYLLSSIIPLSNVAAMSMELKSSSISFSMMYISFDMFSVLIRFLSSSMKLSFLTSATSLICGIGAWSMFVLA